jgi:hypothetical protein
LATMPKEDTNRVKKERRLELDDTKWIERDDLKAEVVYLGGGNVVALFADESDVTEFTRAYSRFLLEHAPGLQAVFWHEPFQWENSLHDAVQVGFRHLARKKQRRTYSTPLLGLAVTEMCRSTALPATTQSTAEDDDYPISREVQAKETAYLNANRRLEQYMSSSDQLKEHLERFQFPYDFDNLGRSEGEQSYIAIVHADGDRMGKRFREVGQGKPNRDYILAIRRFSDAVNNSAQLALQDTLYSLIRKLQSREKDILVHRTAFGDVLAEVVLQQYKDGRSHFLPFRPIVFGGDDVTFVCDGRLGISLALEYMRQFEQYSAKLVPGGAITASAGVAIVKSHYPFAQAYAISEELAKSAKAYRDETMPIACLDWHFARSGMTGNLAQIRAREYGTKHGSLTLRPVTLLPNPKESYRAWPVIEAGVVAFQDLHRSESKRKPDWSSRRNKIMALRERLREGPIAVQKFRAKFNDGELLPDVSASMNDWPQKGWQGQFCGYFDAIEMLDWFIPLHETQGEEA